MSWMKAKKAKLQRDMIEAAAQKKYKHASQRVVCVVSRKADNEFVGEFRSVEHMIRAIPPGMLRQCQWVTVNA